MARMMLRSSKPAGVQINTFFDDRRHTEGHGPAHYLAVTLKGGKTEQILLSEEMLPVARQYLENYKRWWDALEKVSDVNRRLLRLRARELLKKPERGRS
jgi:hypothetical protein